MKFIKYTFVLLIFPFTITTNVYCKRDYPLALSAVKVIPNGTPEQIRGNQSFLRQEKLKPEYAKELIETSPEQVKTIIEKFKASKETNDPKLKKILLPKILLLSGPCGVAKSDLAKAIAQEIDVPFVFIDTALLGNQYDNSTAINLEYSIKKAREMNSEFAVVVLNDIEALIQQHVLGERIAILELTNYIQQNENDPKLFFIATANNHSKLPNYIKKYFRYDTIKIELPDQKTREKIAQFFLAEPIAQKKIDEKLIKKIARETYDLTGRNVHSIANDVIRELILNPDLTITEDCIKKILKRHRDNHNLMYPSPTKLESLENFLASHQPETFLITSGVMLGLVVLIKYLIEKDKLEKPLNINAKLIAQIAAELQLTPEEIEVLLHILKIEQNKLHANNQ